MIKNIIRIILILSTILLFVQCSGQNNESIVETINIDIDKSVLASEVDLIKSIRILPVEEDSLVHFQWIKKIQESGGDYFILNGTIQEVLMCFTPWSDDELLIQRNTNLFFEGNNFKIALVDREGGLLKKYMPYDEPIIGGGGSHFRLQRFGEYIDYLPRFSDEIYRIEKDSCYKKYDIAFDKPTIEVGTRNPSFDLMGEIFNQSFYESSSMIMAKYIYNQEIFESYYNKKDKTVTTINIYQKQIGQEFMGLNKNVIGFLGEQLVYSTTGLEIHNVIEELDPEGVKISNRDIITSVKEKDDDITYLLFVGF